MTNDIDDTANKCMNAALDAIYDETVKLLLITPPDASGIEEGLRLIQSIARYKIDVRYGDEK